MEPAQHRVSVGFAACRYPTCGVEDPDSPVHLGWVAFHGLPGLLQCGPGCGFHSVVILILKGFFGGFFVVFGGHTDDNATLFEFLDPHLKLSEHLSDA